jgi:Flp pilus assembly protein TadG
MHKKSFPVSARVLPKHLRQKLSTRSRGNMLLVTIVVIVFVIMPVAYFSLEFIRMLGAHQQQRSAIDAAAMAAGNDLSKIVD